MTKIQKSKESFVKNIFESISKDYDLMNDLITFKYHSKWKKEIALIAKEDNPKVILDIATGTGDIAINLSELKDSQIARLIGITKNSVTSIRNKSYWNYNSLNPKDPVAMNLFSQKDLIEAQEKAERRIKREKKEKEKAKQAKEVSNNG